MDEEPQIQALERTTASPVLPMLLRDFLDEIDRQTHPGLAVHVIFGGHASVRRSMCDNAGSESPTDTVPGEVTSVHSGATVPVSSPPTPARSGKADATHTTADDVVTPIRIYVDDIASSRRDPSPIAGDFTGPLR